MDSKEEQQQHSLWRWGLRNPTFILGFSIWWKMFLKTLFYSPILSFINPAGIQKRCFI